MNERLARLDYGNALDELGGVAGGGECTATVTVTHETPHDVHAMLSAPCGAYQWIQQPCFY